MLWYSPHSELTFKGWETQFYHSPRRALIVAVPQRLRWRFKRLVLPARGRGKWRWSSRGQVLARLQACSQLLIAGVPFSNGLSLAILRIEHDLVPLLELHGIA